MRAPHLIGQHESQHGQEHHLGQARALLHGEHHVGQQHEGDDQQHQGDGVELLDVIHGLARRSAVPLLPAGEVSQHRVDGGALPATGGVETEELAPGLGIRQVDGHIDGQPGQHRGHCEAEHHGPVPGTQSQQAHGTDDE